MRPLRSAFGDDAVVLNESDFQLLLLATIFPILGTALVSPLLDSLIEPFGTTPGNVGLMVSFVTGPAIVVIPISGILADRYGRRPVLVTSLLLFGIGGSAIVLTNDFRVVLALRFVQGIGFGGIVPTITASIGDMYDGGKEVTGQGLRMMVNGISGAAFPLLAGALLALAWQYPFLLYAIALPVAAVVYLRFEEPTSESSEDAGEKDGSAYRDALLGLLRHPRVTSILVARMLPMVVWIGFLTYNSLVVVRVMDGTPFQAAILVSIGNLVFAAGASQVRRILELFGSKFSALVAANVALTVGFIGFLFSPNVTSAIVWVALSGAGFGISISLYRSYITELAPETLRAGVVSLGAAGARVTATATPIAMGLVISATTPGMGETSAIQLAGIGVAIVGGGGGILCLLIASLSSPVPDDLAELAGG
jgi:ACDE family multidrug resistance protein